MKKIVMKVALAVSLLLIASCAGVSSPGVHLISSDPGLVVLPRGETLVMKQGSGKNADYWYITQDGEVLNFHTEAVFTDDKSITLSGEEHITIDFGWPSDDLLVWTDDEVVYIQFPDGMFDTWSVRS